jgi:hypothetical protein
VFDSTLSFTSLQPNAALSGRERATRAPVRCSVKFDASDLRDLIDQAY